MEVTIMDLELDESIIREVLKAHGLTLEDFLVATKKKPVAEQDWIYLIHHFHQPDKVEDMEILHHCEMYEKKNLKGKVYYQKHVKDGKLIQHVLDIKEEKLEEAPEVVYDHLNNGFKVKIMIIDKKKYAVLVGLVNVKKTKWSDMDKGSLI
jgi:predicted metal-dependent hydrolase